MADAKLTALTAASALAAADLFYVSQSAASRKATGTQLLALVGTAYVPLAGGTMTGALTIASGTLTASAPALNITQTWTTGATFSAALINVTDTSSNSNSLLQEWQIAGSTVARIRKDGTLFLSGGFSAGGSGFVSSLVIGGSVDLYLVRDAAATLAQRNGTNAQTLRVYGTYTDSSNYERLAITSAAGFDFSIIAETLGTGADNLNLKLTAAGSGEVQFRSYAVAYLGLGVGTGGGDGYMNSAGYRVRSTGRFSFAQTDNATDTADTAMARNAAGIVEVNNGTAGTYRDLLVRNLLNTEYHQMTEMTAPAAGAANTVRIYAVDNGAGKTQLMALFASGAAQQLAIEP